MMTPQLTEQYGQVLRVSVAREIFRLWVWAYTGTRLNPKAEKPTPPTRVPLMKVLRENSIAASATSQGRAVAFSSSRCRQQTYFLRDHRRDDRRGGSQYTPVIGQQSTPSQARRHPACHTLCTPDIASRTGWADNRDHGKGFLATAHSAGGRVNQPAPVCCGDSGLLRPAGPLPGRPLSTLGKRIPKQDRNRAAGARVRSARIAGTCVQFRHVPIGGRSQRSCPPGRDGSRLAPPRR